MGKKLQRRSPEERRKRIQWLYLLGWIFLAVIGLIVNWVGVQLFEQLDWLVQWLVPSGSLAWKIAVGVILLIAVPLAAGTFAQFLMEFFHGRRNVDALMQMQQKLFAELEPGDQGYRVALVDTPNASVRSLAVVTGTFEESETGRELAAIFLPNTPDPTKGSMRVVPVEDLSFTGWTVDDLTTFHLTFGSVSPRTC